MTKIKTLVVLTGLLVQVAAFSAPNVVSLNDANDIKKYSSGTALICYLSLSCDVGSYQSDIFVQSLYDLKGLNLGVFNINSFPYEIANGFGFDLGSTVIIVDNKIVATNYKDTSVYSEIGGNLALRLWLSNKLKELKIKSTIKVPAQARAKPIDTGTTAVDLKKGNIAWFTFDSLKDSSPADSQAYEGGGEISGVKNGTYFMDGNYNKTGRQGLTIVESKEIKGVAQDSFSFGVNVKLDSNLVPKSYGSEFLAAGATSVLLYHDASNKLGVYITGDRLKPGSKDVYDTWGDYYLLTDADFKLDEWTNIQFAMDFESKRLKIVINGKRINDILLTDEIAALIRRDADWTNNEICQFGNSRSGGLLYGLADDFVYYNRSLSGAELIALSKRDAKEKRDNTDLPPPPPKTDGNDSPSKVSVWNGTWETFWGSETDATVKLELTVKGAKVTGNYKYQNGKLEGIVRVSDKDQVLSGSWTQSNGKTGWFTFTMSKDNSKFSGIWGYDGENEADESWNGYRSTLNFGKSFTTAR